MSNAADLRSGKGSADENFPVASRLIAPRYRGVILAFYEFVRTADDVADHAALTPEQKLAALDRLEASLLGEDDGEVAGITLRNALAERGLAADHACDLLRAFRLDVTKQRYQDWDDLISYCRYSAMPVGRFVLDVHGEARSTWPASDALCAALQVINHLQDCGKDYQALDRVYIPLDAFAAEGEAVEALGRAPASPGLRRVIVALADRTAALLEQSRVLSAEVRDARLACEIATIQALAERLVALLRVRDPLSERVHLSKAAMAGTSLAACARVAAWRAFRGLTFSRSSAGP